ncbi:MAG TPA: pyridoxine 5'-phosphate synthase, partial [Holophaga sp.]|nr:pyridoxine 5'-phosphate synthase [Holophaga sp.]
MNIDHVATLRQARLGHEHEPVAAGLLAQGA